MVGRGSFVADPVNAAALRTKIGDVDKQALTWDAEENVFRVSVWLKMKEVRNAALMKRSNCGIPVSTE